MDQTGGQPQIFKGIVIHIDLDGVGDWGKGRDLTSLMSEWIRTFGGRVCLRRLDRGCTHVVARHRQQGACREAEARGLQLASPLWPYHCIMKKELLPIVEKPFQGPSIPGFRSHVKEMTISEFKSHERLIVRYLCECTGAAYSGQLTVPTRTSHLIASDLASNSQKIQSAKRCSTVKIVSKMWLDECIAQWRHVPEGPYTEATIVAVPESQEENGASPSGARIPAPGAQEAQPKAKFPPETETTGILQDEALQDAPEAQPKAKFPPGTEAMVDLQEQVLQEVSEVQPKAKFPPETEAIGTVQEEVLEDVPEVQPRAKFPPETEVIGAVQKEVIEDIPEVQPRAEFPSEMEVIGAVQKEVLEDVPEVQPRAELPPETEVIGALQEEVLEDVPEVQPRAKPPPETDAIGALQEEVLENAKADGGTESTGNKGLSSDAPSKTEKVVIPEQRVCDTVRNAVPDVDKDPSSDDAKREDGVRSKKPKGASEVMSFTYEGAYEGLDMSQQVAMASAAVSQLACQLTPATPPAPAIPATEAFGNPSKGDEVQGMDSVRQSRDQDLEVPDVSGSRRAVQPAPESKRADESLPSVERQDVPKPCLDAARESAAIAAGSGAGGNEDADRDGDVNMEEGSTGAAFVGSDTARPMHHVVDGAAKDAVAVRDESLHTVETGQPCAGGDGPGPAANGLCEQGEGYIAAGKAGRKWRAPRMKGVSVSGKGRDTPKGGCSNGGKGCRRMAGKRSATKAAATCDDEEGNAGPELRASLEQNGLEEHQPSKSGRPAVFRKGRKSAEMPCATPQKTARKVVQSGRKATAKRERGDALGVEAVVSKRSRISEVGTGVGREKETVVALSGVRSSQRLRYTGILASLHVQCTSGVRNAKHQWTSSITHVVSPSLKRNEKSVCGMAAGSWLVGTDYVEACGREHKLLDPVDYELQSEEEDAISKGAPAHWRKRRALACAGAFDGIRAVIYGNVGPPDGETIRRIICAGGGHVVMHSSALSYSSQGINIAVVCKEKTESDRVVKHLVASGLLCVSPEYVIDWVCHPLKALSMHRLFGTSPSPVLEKLEKDRKNGGEA